MKRRLLIVAVFLLAGAVANVAVAWCYSIPRWLPTGRGATVRLDRGEAKQEFADRLGVDAMPTGGYEDRYIGRRYLVVYIDHPDAALDARGRPVDHRSDHHLQVYTNGWPCLALEGQFGFVGGQFKAGWLLIIPWELSHMPFMFPLRPIWPGFAVNTIFYATVLWLLIPGPFVLRRFIRVRRGLCPACAYPRGEADVCSECGLALQKRSGYCQ